MRDTMLSPGELLHEQPRQPQLLMAGVLFYITPVGAPPLRRHLRSAQRHPHTRKAEACSLYREKRRLA